VCAEGSLCVRVCVCVCNVRVFVYIICAFAYWRESGLNIVSKETQYSVKRDPIQCQKTPNKVSKETQYDMCVCLLAGVWAHAHTRTGDLVSERYGLKGLGQWPPSGLVHSR
jgi:hypothetical protein